MMGKTATRKSMRRGRAALRRACLFLAVCWALAAAPWVTPWLAPFAQAQEPPRLARQIMQAVYDREEGNNRSADLRMTLVDRNKNRIVRQIRMFRTKSGKGTQTILFVRAPAELKNTALLIYDYDEEGKADEQWLYMPGERKAARIAGGERNEGFLDSDFSYADMARPSLNAFRFRLMKEPELNGQPTWQIQALPRTPEVADGTGYSKSVLWVRKDNYVVVRVIHWLNKSRRLKYMQVIDLELIEDVWVPSEIQMAVREGRDIVHTTVLQFANVRFNVKFEKRLFSLRSLRRGLE